MSHAIDIRDVIQRTTSEVPLEQLQQKGFTTVKVLDRAAIKGMIAEAVNKVVEERHRGLSETEREHLRQEAKAEFDNKMREFRVTEAKQRESLEEQLHSREGRVDKLRHELQEDRNSIEAREARIEAREGELRELAAKAEGAESQLRELNERLHQLRGLEDQLRAQEEAIREREIRVQLREEADQAAPSTDAIGELIRSALREANAENQGQAGAGELSEIKQSLQNLAASMARAGGAAGSDIAALTDAASIEALVARAGVTTSDMENNLGAVEVKESKAKSVNANLAKLKNLKKGGA